MTFNVPNHFSKSCVQISADLSVGSPAENLTI